MNDVQSSLDGIKSDLPAVESQIIALEDSIKPLSDMSGIKTSIQNLDSSLTDLSVIPDKIITFFNEMEKFNEVNDILVGPDKTSGLKKDLSTGIAVDGCKNCGGEKMIYI